MKNFFDNFKKRDFVVILISILALVVFFVGIKLSKEKEQVQQEALVESVRGSSETETNQTTVSNGNVYIINEISSDGQVELFNSNSKEIDISNQVVYSRGKAVYTVPDNTVIGAGEFYTFETGTSFADTDNNVISIFDSDNEIVRAKYFDKIEKGQSYGCTIDGSFEMAYMTSTIGGSNADATVSIKEELAFSVPSGFYDNSFELTISAPDNCTVYYTVDGKEPTVESTEYTSSLYISRPSGNSYVYAISDGDGYIYTDNTPEDVDMGVVVKAIAVDASGKIVNSKTASYFIGYSKDSDYVGIPIITIEVDPEEMFGFESGIYVPGKSYYDGFIQGNNALANYLEKGSASIQMEYYESNKDRTYTTTGSISIYNDGRRRGGQKSFTIKTDDIYPEGTGLDGYLNDASNSLTLLSGGWDSDTKIRNYLVNGLLDGTDVIKKDYMPCIVFINGEYWGLYTLASNYDAYYFEEKYDITDSVVTVMSDYGVPQEYTDFYDYVVSTDFSDEANYTELKSMMDVSNYIEFMCANIYMGNTAMWRNESACVWKTVDGNGAGYSDNRWRWALNNVDSTLGNTHSFIDPYTNGNYSTPIINTYLSAGIKDNAFFNSLLQNDSFANEYLETMNRLIENNFTQEHADEILTDLGSYIGNAVKATNARFNDTSEDLFGFEVKTLGQYFDARTKYITGYTEEYISLKGDVPEKISSTDDTTAEEDETISATLTTGDETNSDNTQSEDATD